MDFCISKYKPEDERYDKHLVIREDLRLSWHSNNNIKNIGNENSPVLISGSLYGALHTTGGLNSYDPARLGKDALDSDGSFTIVIVESRNIAIVTDAGGSIPVYWGYGPNGIAIGTLVHHVARMSGLDEVDNVSVVDYLLYETVCFPYTWYKGIRTLPPGSVCTFDAEGKMDVHTYWQPLEQDNVNQPSDARKWGERIRDKVNRAIRLSIDGKHNGRVLFSGGEDSRAVASLIPKDFGCILTTVLDSKNREYKLAKRAAWWMGRKFQWIPRPTGYYRSSILNRIDLIGPGRDYRHTHIYGTVAKSLSDVDVIFGGWLADSLFKTVYMTNIIKRRRKPDILEASQPDKIKILKNDHLSLLFRKDLVDHVLSRRMEHHYKLKKFRPLTAGNWHSLWPLSNKRDYAHYLSCLKIGPVIVEPFLFSSLYRLAAEMPDTGRVNRRAFRFAFVEAMGYAGWLPTSNRSIPRLGEKSSALFSYMYAKIQSIKYRFGNSYVLQKSWSPDHDGWFPVIPSDHIGQNASERLYKRLESVLSDPMGKKFWQNGTSSAAMCIRTRALALGLEFIKE